MTDLAKRLVIFILIILLMVGFVDHLFFSGISSSHLSQEANCPIHSGVVQLERAQSLVQISVNRIGEKQDTTHAFELTAKISHPPTI
jgi:hypothetical protein